MNEEAHSADVEAELTGLQRSSVAQLRASWPTRWGRAPTTTSADLLRRIIAWRLQAEVCGGLDDEALADLELRRRKRELRPGTRLTREYRGALYHVDVEPDGLIYAGARYRSLSQIASHITGTHWNGPRFFGLR